MRDFLKKILYPNKYNSEVYISFLRKKGVEIGNGCVIYSPNHTEIDIQRPHMLKIGNYVKITSGVTILTHDYSRSVLCNMRQYGNVGEAANTVIGNNVFVGINSIILMGAHIGNNTIVGAGSVVSGEFEDNVVIAGNPAKVVCSLESFYEKRKSKEISAAKEYVTLWRNKYQRDPTIEEMTNAFSWLYLPREIETFTRHDKLFRLRGVDLDMYKTMFMESSPIYKSFEDFLRDCNDND